MTVLSSLFSPHPAASTLNTDTDVSGNYWVLDEDDMTSNSNTKVVTQQSTKVYVDTKTAIVDGGVI